MGRTRRSRKNIRTNKTHREYESECIDAHCVLEYVIPQSNLDL
ncbi:MAG: hypothetical protein QXJ51_03010 [Sulfolobales archaeon]